jgi:predicted DNA repair protein MutK
MASSLLALLDDITTILDDVAVLTKTAAMKTSGVMGDDLALNAQQVSGVDVTRELPVVWAVAKGSFINKLILVPAALAISAWFPVAILPLMMFGGLFLCYEGIEKLLHKMLHGKAEDEAHRAEHLAALANPEMDVVALEKEKVKGAIRTDFVLSAEIIVITLGTMSTAPIMQQILALSAVAIAATVFVYGLVAGIVKLDDLGLALKSRASATSRRIGDAILRAAPILMKSLSILGTAAMFTVGGSILVHGIPVVHHFIEGLAGHGGFGSWAITTALDALFGVLAGAIAVGLMMIVKRMRPAHRNPATRGAHT